MKDPQYYTDAILAGFAAALFIFIALVLIVKAFKSKPERKWMQGKDGVWKFCECGDNNCSICNPRKI